MAALDKLEEKGYIVTEERKVARVVYRADEATYRRNAANYFVPRREGILDFPCAGNLLFLPVWEAGDVYKRQGAVLSLSKAMAADYIGDGVRVNCVCPGTVLSPSLQSRIDSEADPEAAYRRCV